MAMGKFSERGDSPPEKQETSPSVACLYAGAPAVESFSFDIAPSRQSAKCFVGYVGWEAMKRSGWQQGLVDLARDVTRVLFVYALVLQMLAPVAIARAEAGNGFANYGVLCVAMVGDSAEKPANLPLQIVHNCLSCCLGSPVAILAPPVELPQATSYGPVQSPPVPKGMVWSARSDVPPPQRAPPVRA